ncbi:hypothetical protein QJS66_19350 [Kocuria rhizophila]|nr:hypothetical protein QJS66_19350 [Kocuria rhizophila]
MALGRSSLPPRWPPHRTAERRAREALALLAGGHPCWGFLAAFTARHRR